MWLGSCGAVRGEGGALANGMGGIIRYMLLYTLRKIHQLAHSCSMSGQNIEKDQTVVVTGVQGAFHRLLLSKQKRTEDSICLPCCFAAVPLPARQPILSQTIPRSKRPSIILH